MSPVRPLKPGNRGVQRTVAMIWHTPNGPNFKFHLSVRFDFVRRANLSPPREIWLKASKRAGREGSALATQADDVGISLSLLLQHGHAIDELRGRYKPGSLSRQAVETAWHEAALAGADVPDLPAELIVAGATEVQG